MDPVGCLDSGFECVPLMPCFPWATPRSLYNPVRNCVVHGSYCQPIPVNVQAKMTKDHPLVAAPQPGLPWIFGWSPPRFGRIHLDSVRFNLIGLLPDPEILPWRRGVRREESADFPPNLGLHPGGPSNPCLLCGSTDFLSLPNLDFLGFSFGRDPDLLGSTQIECDSIGSGTTKCGSAASSGAGN